VNPTCGALLKLLLLTWDLPRRVTGITAEETGESVTPSPAWLTWFYSWVAGAMGVKFLAQGNYSNTKVAKPGNPASFIYENCIVAVYNLISNEPFNAGDYSPLSSKSECKFIEADLYI